MINKQQLLEVIITPALESVSLWSQSAENLVLGTCAQESLLGTYLKQINGSALSIYQIEAATYLDIWRYLNKKPVMTGLILKACNSDTIPPFEEIGWNLRLATIMCRIKYWMIPEGLPDAGDIKGLAAYWKKYYNTRDGKGTEEQFIENYFKYARSGSSSEVAND